MCGLIILLQAGYMNVYRLYDIGKRLSTVNIRLSTDTLTTKVDGSRIGLLGIILKGGNDI